MSRFRKRPIEVDAEQWWPGVSGVRGVDLGTIQDPRPYVTTIHGQRAYLAPGDWIIAEPDGLHHYPCNPGVFAATYERVAPKQDDATYLKRPDCPAICPGHLRAPGCVCVAVEMDVSGCLAHVGGPRWQTEGIDDRGNDVRDLEQPAEAETRETPHVFVAGQTSADECVADEYPGSAFGCWKSASHPIHTQPGPTPKEEHGFVRYPKDRPPRYNGSSEPCDMLVGPCSCGAWHNDSEPGPTGGEK